MNQPKLPDGFPDSSSDSSPDEPPSPLAQPLVVELENKQTVVDLDSIFAGSTLGDHLVQLAEGVLGGEGITRGEVSIALVDDREIHELNNAYLQHDYPTDTLSFLLDSDDGGVIGQVIVSTETALRGAEVGRRTNEEYGVRDEVALYVAHATLHLVGYDDHDPIDRGRMRAAEVRYLGQCGFAAPAALEDSSLETLG